MGFSNKKLPGADSDAVDLDQLLEVSAAQIRSILVDGNHSMEELSRDFRGIGKTLDTMKIRVRSCVDKSKHSQVDNYISDISDCVDSALVSFQFFDRLTQRLEHVIHGIDLMSKDLGSCKCGSHKETLYEEIRDSYSLSEEQAIFEDMVGKQKSHPVSNSDSTGEKRAVELF